MIPAIPARVVSAFTRNGNGANPAGIVLDADDLSEPRMLDAAKHVGLSETAFVSRSDVADFKLDILTPTHRIAHCGHATVGNSGD